MYPSRSEPTAAAQWRRPPATHQMHRAVTLLGVILWLAWMFSLLGFYCSYVTLVVFDIHITITDRLRRRPQVQTLTAHVGSSDASAFATHDDNIQTKSNADRNRWPGRAVCNCSAHGVGSALAIWGDHPSCNRLRIAPRYSILIPCRSLKGRVVAWRPTHRHRSISLVSLAASGMGRR